MKMKEVQSYLVIALIFVVLIVGFAAVTRAISGTDIPFAVVESPSMTPTMPTGSLIFIQKISPQDIVAGSKPIGDIIVFDDPEYPTTTVTDYGIFAVYSPTPWSHRVINETEINGTYYFLTKGDANLFPDENPNNPGTWVPQSHVIGKIVWYVPDLGYPFLWIKNPVVIVIILVILVIIAFVPIGNKKEEKSDKDGNLQK
jgi:signal peptidase